MLGSSFPAWLDNISGFNRGEVQRVEESDDCEDSETAKEGGVTWRSSVTVSKKQQKENKQTLVHVSISAMTLIFYVKLNSEKSLIFIIVFIKDKSIV